MNVSLKKNGSFYASLLCSAAVCVAIFCFSAQNAAESSSVSVGFSEKLLSLFGEQGEKLKTLAEAIDGFVRKAAHFSIYASLGFFTGFSAFFRKSDGKPCVKSKAYAFRTMLVLPILFCVVYAASDEFHQLFVEGRACRVTDVLIDSAGAFCGICIGFLLLLCVSHFQKKKKRKNEGKRSANT